MVYLNSFGVVLKDKNKSALVLWAIAIVSLVLAGFILPALAHNNNHGNNHHGGHHYNHDYKVVTPSDLELPPNLTTPTKTWYFFDDNTNIPTTTESLGDYEFTNEVGGSHRYSSVKLSPEAAERWNLATNQLAGKDLDNMSKLSFNQYVPSTSTGGAGVTLFLNIDVDFDNSTTTGYQGRLVYLPQDNGTVELDEWQKWDAIDHGDANWQWSGFVANGNKWPDNNTNPVRTWDDIKTAFPNAEVFNESFTGQTLIRGGHPGPDGLVGYVDGVTLNHTKYDFESDECHFVTHGNKYKLKNDCITDETIFIPDGMTLDGRGHTITAIDPEGGHFLGAVVKNAGDEASVKDLKIKTEDLIDACDAGNDRLRGILFDGASGEIEDVKILALNQGNSGCQEGNGIEARYFNPDGTDITTGPRKKVKIHDNSVNDYQKTGIITNGYLDAEVKDNKVSNSSVVNTLIAANSIQVGFGAKTDVKDNRIEGNQYCGPSNTVATAILVFGVNNARVEDNYISGNSDVGIYLDYTGHAKVKDNKVKDQGADCNVNFYDIGIGNYGGVGSTSQFHNNHIHGFDTPFDS